MAGTRTNLVIALAICTAMVAIAWGPSMASAALTCSDVQKKVAPCLTYLRATGNAKPASTCCVGVKSLASSNSADHRTACSCLKTAAGKIPGILPDKAASLPSACGANIPYKISMSTNCANIK